MLAAGSLFASAGPAGADPVLDVVGPGSQILAPLDTATALTGFEVSGGDGDTVYVQVSAGSGTLDLPVTDGLSITGGSTGTELTFHGNQDDVNAALAALSYTGSAAGADTVTVTLLQPGQFICPATGHVYQVESGSFVFDQALLGAESLFGGAGYLATVTSASENDCIYAGIDAFTGDGRNAWIGAHLVEGSTADWEWITGPEAGTTFWTGGREGAVVPEMFADWDRIDVQPQDDSGQACGQYYNSGGLPTWHDNGCDAGNKFVAEADASALSGPTATATVRVLPAPPAPDDLTSSAAGVTGQAVTVEIPAEGSVTLLDGDTPVNSLTIAGQGVYTLDPATGVIRFSPVLGFVGTPTPATFRTADADDQTGTATYTPTVTLPPAPTASAAVSSGTGTDPQTTTVPIPEGGTVTLQDGDAPVTELTVAGEGAYTLDPATGIITFIPILGHAGESTPVAFRITDAYDQSATGSYTATVLPPAAPPAPAVTSTGQSGSVQTAVVPVPTGGTAALLDGGLTVLSVTIAGQGTYAIDPDTGTITFTALQSFSGLPDPVNYQVLDAYGQVGTGSYAPTVIAVPTTSTSTSSSATTAGPSSTSSVATTTPVATTAGSPALAYTGFQTSGSLTAAVLLLVTGFGLILTARLYRRRSH